MSINDDYVAQNGEIRLYCRKCRLRAVFSFLTMERDRFGTYKLSSKCKRCGHVNYDQPCSKIIKMDLSDKRVNKKTNTYTDGYGDIRCLECHLCTCECADYRYLQKRKSNNE